MVDTDAYEDFPVYAGDEAELAQLRAEATPEQHVAREIELTGTVEDILRKARAGG